MLDILTAVSSMSPLAVIALLAWVIYQQVIHGKGQKEIASNHLHDLPEMAAMLREMNATLHRIEEVSRDLHDNVLYVKARLNGGSHQHGK